MMYCIVLESMSCCLGSFSTVTLAGMRQRVVLFVYYYLQGDHSTWKTWEAIEFKEGQGIKEM